MNMQQGNDLKTLIKLNNKQKKHSVRLHFWVEFYLSLVLFCRNKELQFKPDNTFVWFLYVPPSKMLQEYADYDCLNLLLSNLHVILLLH